MKPKEPPEIGEACNITMFFEKESIYRELQIYKSAPVLHLSNLPACTTSRKKSSSGRQRRLLCREV